MMSIGEERLRDLIGRLPKNEPVPAISIRQPWATAVFLLGKDIENRSHWLYKYRGPMVIHAAQAAVNKADLDEAITIARKDGVDKRILRMIEPRGDFYNPGFFPSGIVGLADLAEVFGPTDDIPEGHPAASSPWAEEHSNYWLYLTNVASVVPVDYRGAVGLFKVPYGTVTSLKALSAA